MKLTMASQQAAETSPGAGMPAARIVSGVKVYGAGATAVRALDGVSADFGAGQFTAVMGPSGSGKSTTLHCLAGLDRLTSGQVLIGDVDLGTLDDKGMTLMRRERIGFVFQAFNLIPTLTARENILLPLTLGGKKPARGWLRELARTLGIADRLGHRPSELSGGQQQRVATARALVTRPDLIFADEPTGSLDSRSATELLNQIRRAVDEYRQTVVMVTHDARAAAYADRVLFLADGRVVSDMRSPTADRILDTIRELTEPRDREGLTHRLDRPAGSFQEAGHVARHVGGGSGAQAALYADSPRRVAGRGVHRRHVRS
jgi:putative ABC transport system ATP-binding protein